MLNNKGKQYLEVFFMKKIIGMLLLLVSVYAYADAQVRSKQQLEEAFKANGSEGYDSIPWGATFEEVSALYPKAKVEKTDDYSKTLTRNGSSSNVTLNYYFFDDKLYKGQTVYDNPDNDTVTALANKLVSLYGKNFEKKDIYDKGKTYYSAFEKSFRADYGLYGDYYLWKKEGWNITWKKTPTFVVQYDIINLYTKNFDYEDYQPNSVQTPITYENPKRNSEIENIKQKRKEDEIKKKMNDLDL